MIPVVEMFGPTIQGEGIMTGTITHFLRTGGCPLRCSWCDSMHAVDPAQVKRNAKRMSTAEIISAVHDMPRAPWMTLTGGDPCIHKELGDVIAALQPHMRFAVETQGTEFPLWLSDCDVVTFSPKPPSSGNPVDISKMLAWIETWAAKSRRICIKVVVDLDDPRDLEYALDVYARVKPQLIEGFYFNACSAVWPITQGTHVPSIRALATLEVYKRLAEHIIKHQHVEWHHKTFVGCQQHVLLWPQHNEGV